MHATQRISPAEYRAQSRDYTRQHVSMLVRSKDFATFAEVRRCDDSLQSMWMVGTFVLGLAFYFDVVIAYATNSGFLAASARAHSLLGQWFPVLNLIPCSWVMLSVWVHSPWESITTPVLAHVLPVLTLAYVDTGLGVLMPDFSLTPSLFWRAVPLATPMLTGWYFRHRASIHWKSRSTSMGPYTLFLTLPMAHMAMTLVVWCLTSGLVRGEPLSINALFSPVALFDSQRHAVPRAFPQNGVAGTFMKGYGATSSPSIDLYSAMTVYTWLLALGSLLIGPVLEGVVSLVGWFLPRNAAAWFFVLGCTVVVAVELYLHDLMTTAVGIGIAVFLGSMALSGFEY